MLDQGNKRGSSSTSTCTVSCALFLFIQDTECDFLNKLQKYRSKKSEWTSRFGKKMLLAKAKQ